MRFHDAPLLEGLCIGFGAQCPVDADVERWVAKAVDRSLRILLFGLLWKSKPIRMPNSLYTCKTLKKLTLFHKIIVDVPSPVSLPSLIELHLLSVVYKEEDSHVKLFSSCPVLKLLKVVRPFDLDDNVRNFSVKVPSLLRLTYKIEEDEDIVQEDEEVEEDEDIVEEDEDIVEENEDIVEEDEDEDDTGGSLVIDTPALVSLDIDCMGHSCSIEYMPQLVELCIDVDAEFYPNENFLRSLSSVKYLFLANTMVPWCNAVNYSRIIECAIDLYDTDLWGSLVVLLSNCPQLKKFKVEFKFEIDESENHAPVLWDQPSSVPKCLSSHLMIFKWKRYSGREDEKKLIRYILQNSKCLKTAKISSKSPCSAEEKQKMIEELESMHMGSTSVLRLNVV